MHKQAGFSLSVFLTFRIILSPFRNSSDFSFSAYAITNVTFCINYVSFLMVQHNLDMLKRYCYTTAYSINKFAAQTKT